MRNEPSWRPGNQNRKRRVKRCGWRFKAVLSAEETDYIHHTNLAYADTIIGLRARAKRRVVVVVVVVVVITSPNAERSLAKPFQCGEGVANVGGGRETPKCWLSQT